MKKERTACLTCGKDTPEAIQGTTFLLNKRGRIELAPWSSGCLIWTLFALGGVVAFLFAPRSSYSRMFVLIPSVLILLFSLLLWLRLPHLTQKHLHSCKACGYEWEEGEGQIHRQKQGDTKTMGDKRNQAG